MDNLVITHDQQVVTTSLKVAEVFRKRHGDVIRSIELKIQPAQNCVGYSAENSAQYQSMFCAGEYLDAKGEQRKMYYLNRDGLAFIAFGFTGRQADKFKLEYIREFNRMEAQLKNPPSATRLDADQLSEVLKYIDARVGRALDGRTNKPQLPLGIRRSPNDYSYDYATPERLAWAKNIRDRMAQLDVSQTQVASALGIAPNYLCAILSGQRKAKKLLPKIDMVIALWPEAKGRY